MVENLDGDLNNLMENLKNDFGERSLSSLILWIIFKTILMVISMILLINFFHNDLKDNL